MFRAHLNAWLSKALHGFANELEVRHDRRISCKSSFTQHEQLYTCEDHSLNVSCNLRARHGASELWRGDRHRSLLL